MQQRPTVKDLPSCRTKGRDFLEKTIAQVVKKSIIMSKLTQVLIVLVRVSGIKCKVFDVCDLALLEQRFRFKVNSEDVLGGWVCIAQSLSSFNTCAVDRDSTASSRLAKSSLTRSWQSFWLGLRSISR